MLAANGIPSAQLPKILVLLSIPDPTVLLQSGLPGPVIGALEGALAVANARAYSLVWVALAVLVGAFGETCRSACADMRTAAAAIPCAFLRPVSAAMNDHVESALEDSNIRTRQLKEEI